MAIDSKHLTSDQTRPILVTDVEWRFDGGLRDLVTLREGDSLDTQSEPGWIVITLQPLVAGAFPEVVRHQVCKVISERHQMRIMQVRVDPPTGLGPTEDTGVASGTPPVDPAPRDSEVLPPADTDAPGDPAATTPSESPSPRPQRPRRKTSRPSDRG